MFLNASLMITLISMQSRLLLRSLSQRWKIASMACRNWSSLGLVVIRFIIQRHSCTPQFIPIHLQHPFSPLFISIRPQVICVFIIRVLTSKMQEDDCELGSATFGIQVGILVVSLCSSILTAAMIVSRKLYNHPFAFLIMTIQLCYATMAILDLLSKAFTSDDLWCRVVTPVIYGMITSSFFLMEIFCFMIYQTIKRQSKGFLNNHIKKVTLGVVTTAVAINCIGVEFYAFGFCHSCGFNTPVDTAYSGFVKVLVKGDYFVPLVLVFPIFYLICKLRNARQSDYMDATQRLGYRVLLIPMLNFLVLTVNAIVTSIPRKGSVSSVAYVFLFQSLYFVSLINLVFYHCFVSFFRLYEPDDGACCQCPKLMSETSISEDMNSNWDRQSSP